MTPAAVLAQMAAAGLPDPPQPFDVSGRVRRFGPKKRCWYVLPAVPLRSGRLALSGAFGDWGHVPATRVEWADAPDVDPLVMERLRAQRAADDAQRARRTAHESPEERVAPVVVAPVVIAPHVVAHHALHGLRK